MKCVGKCEVEWSETTRRTVNGKTQSHTTYYRAYEEYLCDRKMLEGDGNELID